MKYTLFQNLNTSDICILTTISPHKQDMFYTFNQFILNLIQKQYWKLQSVHQCEEYEVWMDKTNVL